MLVDTTSPTFLALDLAGVFAFALNGSLTAIRLTRLDIVGVVTLRARPPADTRHGTQALVAAALA